MHVLVYQYNRRQLAAHVEAASCVKQPVAVLLHTQRRQHAHIQK